MKKVLIVTGIAGAGFLAYWLWKKKKNAPKETIIASTVSDANVTVIPNNNSGDSTDNFEQSEPPILTMDSFNPLDLKDMGIGEASTLLKDFGYVKLPTLSNMFGSLGNETQLHKYYNRNNKRCVAMLVFMLKVKTVTVTENCAV